MKHVGVYFTSFIKPNGYLYEAYSATFMANGKQFKRHFSIKKYGKFKALELAKEARKQGTIKT